MQRQDPAIDAGPLRNAGAVPGLAGGGEGASACSNACQGAARGRARTRGALRPKRAAAPERKQGKRIANPKPSWRWAR